MNNKFDDIVRKKLNDFDSPYPDHMWASIASQLPEKKRKPYFLWISAIFGILLFTGLAYFTFFQGQKLNPSQDGKSAMNIDKAQPLAQATLNNESKPFTKEHLNSEFSNDASSQDAFSKDNNNNLAANQNAQENKYNAPTTNKLTYPNNNKFNSKNQALSTNTVVSKAGNAQETSSTSGVLTSNNQSTVEENEMPSMVDQSLELNSGNSGRTRLTNLSAIASAHTRSIEGKNHIEEDLNSFFKKQASLSCPTFVKKQNLTFLEFYFSNEFAERSLDIKRGDGVSYVQLREKTELSHLSNSFGFRIGMGWESGIAFKTGFNYSNINEKFIYTDPNSIQKKTITVVKYIYDDKFNVVDSTITHEVVEIPGTNTIIAKNRYSFIDIPVLFQYSIPGRKRLSYDVTVGPYINLVFTQRGRILDATGKNLIVLGDAQNNSLYNNNIGLSFYGSFAINYQLTKNLKISLEPNVRFMTNSMTSYTNNLDQKYLIAGVGAGVKMKI